MNITERLRTADPLSLDDIAVEAADVIDALVSALEETRGCIDDNCWVMLETIDAALAKAKGE